MPASLSRSPTSLNAEPTVECDGWTHSLAVASPLLASALPRPCSPLASPHLTPARLASRLASPLLATASSHGTSHAASEAPSSPLAAEEGTGAGAGAATPRPFLALSAVLVGLAALSIGVSIARRR